MSGPPQRLGLIMRIVNNFWNSVSKGRHIDSRSQIRGEDILGNKYFEIPADPSRGRRRARRWYTNEVSEHHDVRDTTKGAIGFDAEIPAEWESWLRFRRDAPPTEKQVLQSLALADMKKVTFHYQFQFSEIRTSISKPLKQPYIRGHYWKYIEFEMVQEKVLFTIAMKNGKRMLSVPHNL